MRSAQGSLPAAGGTTTRRVHEVMTGNPVTMEQLTSLAEAARVMRDADIGDVLVVDQAVDLMRRHALRRLPVESENGELVGIVSLGDLEVERDPGSPLSSIAAAEHT